MTSMLRSRAARRSCRLHGDNGCENQRQAAVRDRALDTRRWRRELATELLFTEPAPPVGNTGPRRAFP